MTQDIAELCKDLRRGDYDCAPFSLMDHAASTIERLQAELESAHRALKAKEAGPEASGFIIVDDSGSMSPHQWKTLLPVKR